MQTQTGIVQTLIGLWEEIAMVSDSLYERTNVMTCLASEDELDKTGDGLDESKPRKKKKRRSGSLQGMWLYCYVYCKCYVNLDINVRLMYFSFYIITVCEYWVYKKKSPPLNTLFICFAKNQFVTENLFKSYCSTYLTCF